jgi:hypothetical protein
MRTVAVRMRFMSLLAGYMANGVRAGKALETA